MRLLDLMESTTRYFAKNGVETPRLTIELLLAEVLQKTRMQLYLEFDRELSDEVCDRLRPMVKQRAEGMPLDYILGHKMFDGHRFNLTPDVLIPRPETELLLQGIVPLIDGKGGPIVDVGTGSGILAVSLARRFPTVPVIALDLSLPALEVARGNAEGIANIEFRQSDLLASWEGKDAQLIVANLPYIPRDVIPSLSREVRREPLAALDGGPDGLDFVRRLLREAVGRTETISLELGDNQMDEVKNLCPQCGFEVTHVMKDLTHRERILIGARHG